jgi:hypothetical protein
VENIEYLAAVTARREAWATYKSAGDAYNTANYAAALVDRDAYAAADAAVRDAFEVKINAYAAFVAAARVVGCLNANKNK